MKSNILVAGALLLGLYLAVPCSADAQTTGTPSMVALDDMEAFQSSADNWQIAGSAAADRRTAGEMVTADGDGVLVYLPGQGTGEMLRTTMEHGSIELELDFMMSRAAQSGIFLQGRYEIQLADSWGVRKPQFSDNGGVPGRSAGGLQPRTNASRAPGLWQHLRVVFRAPEFNDEGEKTANAVLEKVVLNGVVVQEAVELAGPAREAPLQDEHVRGPLVFQGADAAIAFRNIQYTRYDDSDAVMPGQTAPASSDDDVQTASIPVKPTDQPIVLRSYIDHLDDKKMSGVFVGDPEGVHYTLDLEQAALLHVWRGEFLDARTVWAGRGMEPNSRKLDEPVPLGSTVTFSGAPNVAILENENSVWPDTMGGEYQFGGYSLDSSGRPTFRYRLNTVEVTDRFTPQLHGRVLGRRMTFEGASEHSVWIRIAAGETISRQEDGSYDVNNHTFIIELDSAGGAEPVVRQKNGKAELLVPVELEAGRGVVEYSIIW